LGAFGFTSRQSRNRNKRIGIRTYFRSYGYNDTSDFDLAVVSDEAGALPFTSQRIGAAMYLDNGGFRSIATTPAYGNFKIGSLIPQVEPAVKALRKTGVRESARLKGKSQYRAFFADGSGLSIYMARKYPEPMLFQYPMVVNCVSVSDEEDGSELTAQGTLLRTVEASWWGSSGGPSLAYRHGPV